LSSARGIVPQPHVAPPRAACASTRTLVFGELRVGWLDVLVDVCTLLVRLCPLI